MKRRRSAWWKWYQSYINSDQWKAKRLVILRRDNWKCVKCGSCNRLQVHHLTYERVGNEFDSDLITLCEDCHRKEHGRRPRKRKRKQRKPKLSRKQRYAKLFNPAIPADRERMRRMGIPVPPHPNWTPPPAKQDVTADHFVAMLMGQSVA